jgi:putative adenylate-forming enzyme
MMRLIYLLRAYCKTRYMHFRNRDQLLNHQRKQLRRYRKRLLTSSPYFAQFRELPMEQWPLMDKSIMLAHFDTMNSAGLRLQQVMDLALTCEQSRDFNPQIGKVTVGLSSGTSAQRGVFVVDAKERARWAGIMLAKALPDGLFAGERVALFLRANSNLYTSVRNRWLTFDFFDLFQPFEDNARKLAAFRASIIVAPAQVLRALALAKLNGEVALQPKRVISVAEVLEAQDRKLIEQAFGTVHEIYQATEGFLASTCEQGVLHLNEEYVHVEPEWLDKAQRRFVPIITDFSRYTQPIVRYRLNDVLIAKSEPCKCGRVTLALDGIEGRCDDLLLLPGMAGQPVAIFSDLLSRALAQCLPANADYRLIQESADSLQLQAAIRGPEWQKVKAHLEQVLARLGVCIDALHWIWADSAPDFNPTVKRRRIIRKAGVA